MSRPDRMIARLSMTIVAASYTSLLFLLFLGAYALGDLVF